MARERDCARPEWDSSESDESRTESRVYDKVDAIQGDVADLRVAVARIEATLAAQAAHAPKAGLARDGALTISGSALGGAILFVLQHLVGK